MRTLLGFFRKRDPHPFAREISGLISCIVSHHRDVIEYFFLNNMLDSNKLEMRYSALQWYWKGVGISDPFTSTILYVPMGKLDNTLSLQAHYRIETAVSIAWALNLVQEIPLVNERCNREILVKLFPLDADSKQTFQKSKLREYETILSKLNQLNTILNSARKAKTETPCEENEIQFSRAYERTRGLTYICSDCLSIEDVVMKASTKI